MAKRLGSKIDFYFGIRGRRRLSQLDLMLDEVLLCIFPRARGAPREHGSLFLWDRQQEAFRAV
jgi:hypothetical protein